MSASVKITGELERYISRISKDLAKGVDQTVTQAAFLVKVKAQKGIQGGARSGKTYRRGRSGIVGQRSSQGELPKSDTGALVRSISSFKQSFGVAVVGTNLEYGEFLENKDPSRGGRPWLEPTYDLLQPKIEKMVFKSLKRRLNP